MAHSPLQKAPLWTRGAAREAPLRASPNGKRGLVLFYEEGGVIENIRHIRTIPDDPDWEPFWSFVAGAERPDEIEEGTLIAMNVLYVKAYRAVEEADRARRTPKWSWRRAFL